MVKVRLYEKNKGFYESELQEQEIREFSKINRKEYTTKGTFKKFSAVYYITLVDGTLLHTDESTFNNLKILFKNKCNIKKYTDIEYKNLTERKAVNWIYTITV